MNAILKGVRPLDYVLAGLMTAGGAFLMYENISAMSAEDLPHAQSTTTWLMLPAFLLVTLPILWRRRNILAVVGATALTTTAHVFAFGWNTRCGVVLPLSFALAYTVARFAAGWKNHAIGLAGIVVTQLVMLARDASIETVASALPLAIPGVALFYGIGLFVQNRVSKRQPTAVAPVIERAAA